LWRTVRQLTGRQHEPAVDPSITADSLNRHYANVSTDASYEQPPLKYTAVQPPNSTDYAVFKMLDTLRPTATGLDKLLAWFLRLVAPVLCSPVADLINISLLTATVPSQQKQARIGPVPKITSPQQATDYRSISIMPVLSRIIERLAVRHYIYPVLSSPPPSLQFSDQFTLRPTGSTTAAIITLLHIVSNLLSSELYVIVISLEGFRLRTPFPTPP